MFIRTNQCLCCSVFILQVNLGRRTRLRMTSNQFPPLTQLLCNSFIFPIQMMRIIASSHQHSLAKTTIVPNCTVNQHSMCKNNNLPYFIMCAASLETNRKDKEPNNDNEIMLLRLLINASPHNLEDRFLCRKGSGPFNH